MPKPKKGIQAFIRAIGLPLSADVTQGEPKWQEVCKVGTWVDSERGLVELTAEIFKKVVQNFKAGVLGFLPNLNWQHSDVTDVPDPQKDDRSAGKIADLKFVGDTLFGLCDWSAEGVKDVVGKAFTYLSALIRFDFEDRTTGGKVGPVLWSAALTNTPFITGMAPLVFSVQAREYLALSVSRDKEIQALFEACDKIFGITDEGCGMCHPNYELVEWFDDHIVIRKDKALYLAPYKYDAEKDVCSLGDFEEATYAPKKGGSVIRIPQLGLRLPKAKGGVKIMRDKLLAALQGSNTDEEAFVACRAIVEAEITRRSEPTERELALRKELEGKDKALRSSTITSSIVVLRTPEDGKAFAPASLDMLEKLFRHEGEGEIELAQGVKAKDFQDGIGIVLNHIKKTGLVNLSRAPISTGGVVDPAQRSGHDDGSNLIIATLIPTEEERTYILNKTLGGPKNESRVSLEQEGTPVDDESIRKECAVLRVMRSKNVSHQDAWSEVRKLNYGK